MYLLLSLRNDLLILYSYRFNWLGKKEKEIPLETKEISTQILDVTKKVSFQEIKINCVHKKNRKALSEQLFS
jgi:hypothetical protein